MKKVFFIGMNRCATKSFHELFKKSGYVSYHYSCAGYDRPIILADQILENVNNFYPILHNVDDAHAYSDMCEHREDMWIDGVKFYRDLHREYPDAYFILQTRNMYDWLLSKKRHKEGAYIERCKRYWGLNNDDMIDWFEKDRNEHHSEVISYFKNNDKFLQYDIEKDSIETFVNFLKPDFFLNEKHWGHVGKTL